MNKSHEQRMDLLQRGARIRVGAAYDPTFRMAEGRVVAFSDTPMICVLQDDGTKNWWGIDLEMTEVASPPPAPKTPCPEGFHWIGQSFAHCEKCSLPAWEHAGTAALPGLKSPFDDTASWVLQPWAPGEREACRAKWDPKYVAAQDCSYRDDPGHNHEQCLEQADVMPGEQALTILAGIAQQSASTDTQWEAVLSTGGLILDSFDELSELDEADISIRRGTARPEENEEGARDWPRGSYSGEDVIELWDDLEYDEAQIRWPQAVLMAAGLNAVSAGPVS